MSSKIKSIFKAILILILMCVFIWSGYGLYSYADEYNELNESYEEAQDLVQIGTAPEANTDPAKEVIETDPAEETENQEEALPTGPIDEHKDLKIAIDINWEELKSQSKDVVGWLHIPDSNINYPLVHRDNDYYLNHDYKGKWNSGGSIFLEEKTSMDSKNIVIYGHHMKADIMFHRLPYYAEQEYADSHKYIYIVTEKETRLYQVFSVVYTSSNSDTYTWDFGVGSEITFDEYIDSAIANSVVKTDMTAIDENAAIISLSTCTGRVRTERLVVHAVLLTTY